MSLTPTISKSVISLQRQAQVLAGGDERQPLHGVVVIEPVAGRGTLHRQ
jgi:hypothetical protein